ncbi:tetratricopeptide repeat protein [Paractinoplanes ferrugineus]|uniref:ATPase n=1 Tax=Paractinoplanes ferrugineus TaxID=113564 RepID=A0A919JGA4_9ACTN|nr:XRE family transcriptional regulator [Actinoplanes ferrugineus]GIE16671.1 ATPase [Actinoplanes ferrugineus]
MSLADRYDPVRAARVHLGQQLRRLRGDAHLTQRQVAAAVKGGGSTVSDLERGAGSRVPGEGLVIRYIEICIEAMAAPATVRQARRDSLIDEYRNLARLIEYDRENRRSRGRGSDVIESLPRDVPVFFGRESEMSRLLGAAHERPGAIPIHLIEGMPGVGKTALAVHAAHELSRHFPGGTVFLSLNTHAPGRAAVSTTDALATLLIADGVESAAVAPTIEGRAALWRHRTVRRRLLLVLDDAASFAQIEPLLPADGRALVLVTSRHRLGAPSGVTVELAPMAGRSARQLIAGVADLPRVDEAQLDALAAHCGGLPLALGIVAGWVRAHPAVPVSDMLRRLGGAEGRALTVRDGSRTVVAAFEVSYASLPPTARRTFRLLGAHPGQDIDVYGASALIGATVGAARADLNELFERHLIEEPTLGRYRMHDLVAEYAADRAAAEPETGLALRRLSTHYQQTAPIANGLLNARKAATDARRPDLTDRRTALTWLRSERPNVLALMRSQASSGDHAELVGMSVAYASFLRQYGPWDQAAAVYRSAVAAARAIGDRHAEATALFTLAAVQRAADEYRPAADNFLAALAGYEDFADATGVARAHAGLGAVLWRIGEVVEADRHLTAAVEAARRVPGCDAEGEALTELGLFRMMGDRYDEAAALLADAANRQEQAGDSLGAALAWRALGNTYYLSDRYPQARAALSRALAIFEELEHPAGKALALLGLGGVQRLAGDYQPAQSALIQAIELFREISKPSSEAQAMSELGALLGSVGRAEEGEFILRAATAIYRAIDDRFGVAAALNQLGEVLRRRGDLAGAREVLRQAGDLYAELDDRLGSAAVANVDAAVLLDAGAPDRARQRYEDGLGAAESIGNPLETALAHEGLGRSGLMLGDPGALEHLRTAVAIFTRIGAAEASRVTELLADLGDRRSGPAGPLMV